MSLEDLWESEFTLPFILLVFFISIPVIWIISNQTDRGVYERRGNASTQKMTAVVLAKYTAPHPLNQQMPVNMITFELENGTRKSLAIKQNDIYATMLEGDTGILEYAGEMFISFRREQNEKV